MRRPSYGLLTPFLTLRLTLVQVSTLRFRGARVR
jgi:hypothetical protein